MVAASLVRAVGRVAGGRQTAGGVRRAVEVSVYVRGREVDTFSVSDPFVLRAALRPIYRHLPDDDGWLQLRAVSEERRLLGVRRVRNDHGLVDLKTALRFLSA